LFASVPIGSGHRRATEATRRALLALAPGAVTMHIDIMEYVKPFARDMVLDGYSTLLHLAPRLWGYLYEHDAWLQKLAPIENMRRHFQRDRFEALVRDFAPDVFVSSHPLCSVPMAAVKLGAGGVEPKFRLPVVTIVTDFHVHETWVQRGVTMYVVGNETIAPALTDRGLRPEQVRTTGIPVARSFAPDAKDVAALKARFKLDPSKAVALFLLKGLESDFVERALFQVSLLNRPTEVLFNTAGNDALAAVLRRAATTYGVRAKMFGFVDNLDDYVAIADVVTTKPGGLTSAECLALGVPMLLVQPIPGQEERNANFLVEHGAAKRVTNVLTLGAELEVLLGGGGEMTRMRDRAKALGRPKAADEVAALLVDVAADPERFLKLEEPPEQPARRSAPSPEPMPKPSAPAPEPEATTVRAKEPGELEEIGESWSSPVLEVGGQAAPSRARASRGTVSVPPIVASPRATREYLAGLILIEKDLARRAEEAREDVEKWEKRAALAAMRGDGHLMNEASRRLEEARRSRTSYANELDRILAKKAEVKGVPYSSSAQGGVTSNATSVTPVLERRDETPMRVRPSDPEGEFRDLEIDAELKALKDKLDKK
jgi:processive 1,2-diacylglycerol beta-glucosyltransferase